MSDEAKVWDHIAEIERPAPSQEEIDSVQAAVARELSALGAMNGLNVALEVISGLLYGQNFTTGSSGFAGYLKTMANFITARVKQLEKAEAFIPKDTERERK